MSIEAPVRPGAVKVPALLGIGIGGLGTVGMGVYPAPWVAMV
jgi:hypothetical protein